MRIPIRYVALFVGLGLFGCSATEPADRTLPFVEHGIASYYADAFHGLPTASGEIFDMHQVSAAHRTHPFGTIVRVTNLANNRTLDIRVNDRGPFVEGRIIDVSFKAAQELDFVEEGIVHAKVDVLVWGD